MTLPDAINMNHSSFLEQMHLFPNASLCILVNTDQLDHCGFSWDRFIFHEPQRWSPWRRWDEEFPPVTKKKSSKKQHGSTHPLISWMYALCGSMGCYNRPPNRNAGKNLSNKTLKLQSCRMFLALLVQRALQSKIHLLPCLRHHTTDPTRP